MKRILRLICLAMVLAVALAPTALAVEGYEKALNSVVRIYGVGTLTVLYDNVEAMQFTQEVTGTGFAIGEKGKPVDTFVTNKHVVSVDPSDFIEILVQNGVPAQGYNVVDGTTVNVTYNYSWQSYVILEDLDTKKLVARTILSDNYDLAAVVLQNPITEREPATIALYDNLGRVNVWALGFPGVSDNVIRGYAEWTTLPSTLNYCTVNSGTTQFMAQNDTFGAIVQHTAEINSGNSGGPLVNNKNQVIGVNTWAVEEGVNQVNISQTTKQLQQFLTSQNLVADYVKLNSLPLATILIIAAAVLLIAAIVAIAILSSKKKNGGSKIVDPSGSRSLVVSSGSLRQGTSYSLIPGKKFLIGTDGTQCNLAFPKGTPGVSRVHCSITFDGRVVMVKDENSSFGTFIDTQKIEPGKATVIHRGHKLCIGSQKEALTLR